MDRKLKDQNTFERLFAAQDIPNVAGWNDGRTFYPWIEKTDQGIPVRIIDSWSFRINEDGSVTYSGNVPQSIRAIFA